jgi:hypothetical protein
MSCDRLPPILLLEMVVREFMWSGVGVGGDEDGPFCNNETEILKSEPQTIVDEHQIEQFNNSWQPWP